MNFQSSEFCVVNYFSSTHCASLHNVVGAESPRRLTLKERTGLKCGGFYFELNHTDPQEKARGVWLWWAQRLRQFVISAQRFHRLSRDHQRAWKTPLHVCVCVRFVAQRLSDRVSWRRRAQREDEVAVGCRVVASGPRLREKKRQLSSRCEAFLLWVADWPARQRSCCWRLDSHPICKEGGIIHHFYLSPN